MLFRDGCCMLSASVACHPFNSESPGPLEGLGAMRRRGSGLGGLRGSPGVPGGPLKVAPLADLRVGADSDSDNVGRGPGPALVAA
jgi:hypothetical protein